MNSTHADADSIAALIQNHLDICTQLLALAQQEAETLKTASALPNPAIQTERRALLNRLISGLSMISQKQGLWRQLCNERRELKAQMNQLIQTTLDTIMRVLVLDRENEQALLRRGLLPAHSLPPVEQSRPNYVSRLYQNHAQA